MALSVKVAEGCRFIKSAVTFYYPKNIGICCHGFKALFLCHLIDLFHKLENCDSVQMANPTRTHITLGCCRLLCINSNIWTLIMKPLSSCKTTYPWVLISDVTDPAVIEAINDAQPQNRCCGLVQGGTEFRLACQIPTTSIS